MIVDRGGPIEARGVASRLGLVAAVLAAVAGPGCGPRYDFPTERCIRALEYVLHSPSKLDVDDADSDPEAARVSILYETATSAMAARSRGRITCRYDVASPRQFTEVTLGDERLSEVELALVNAELLLGDLQRSADRLDPR